MAVSLVWFWNCSGRLLPRLPHWKAPTSDELGVKTNEGLHQCLEWTGRALTCAIICTALAQIRGTETERGLERDEVLRRLNILSLRRFQLFQGVNGAHCGRVTGAKLLQGSYDSPEIFGSLASQNGVPVNRQQSDSGSHQVELVNRRAKMVDLATDEELFI
jgi:hypothetical protein